MNERAILYRKQNNIPDDLGTAVNVQVMVFGAYQLYKKRRNSAPKKYL